MENNQKNGYNLSRAMFDWSFDNIGKSNPTMIALYFFLIEVNNRLGWCENFGITAKECMHAIGVSSYNTYKKSFDTLVELEFVKIVKPSINQYQAL